RMMPIIQSATASCMSPVFLGTCTPITTNAELPFMEEAPCKRGLFFYVFRTGLKNKRSASLDLFERSTRLYNSVPSMTALPFMLVALLVLTIGYRYYSAFIAAKVLVLDPDRTTPAHIHADGANYDPTNKWVLMGHHFAAIAGAGPLIGPVLAAQFGFLPGYL